MTKQVINVGSSPNDRSGDSLRSAFQKINANFTELYTSLGLNDNNLNLGAFEFNGSVMTTTDSSSILIDQATTISSNLNVGGDILPISANGGDLGSSSMPWKSLYVSGSTIYIGGAALKIDNEGELTLNDNRIVQQNGQYIDLNLNVRDVNVSDPQPGDTLQWGPGFWINVANSDNKLVNGAKEVVLTGGANPYVTFPTVASGENIIIQGAEIASSNGAVAITSSDSVVINTNALITTKSWQFGTDGSLYFPDSTVQTTAFVGTATTAEIARNIESQSDVSIKVNLTDSTQRIWRFGEDGELTLPGGTDTITSNAGGLDFSVLGQDFETMLTFNLGRNGALTVPNSINLNWIGTNTNAGIIGAQPDEIFIAGAPNKRVDIAPNDGANGVFKFGTDGSLTIPGDIKSNGNINIDINLSDSTLRRWQFGEDGILNIPGGIKTSGFTIDLSTYRGVDDAGLGDYTITIDGNNIRSDKDSIGLQTVNGYGIFIDESSKNVLLGDLSSGVEINLLFGSESITGENWDAQLKMPNVGGPGVPSSFSITTQGDTNVWTFGGDGNLTFPDSTTQSTAFTTSPTLNVLKIDDGVHEKFQTKADATGTVTHDCSAGHIFFHTSPDADWTANFTNLNLSSGYATTVTLIIEQGGTGYYPNAVQIGGSSVGILWQGNATPTPSTNRIDVVTFSILYDGLYTVLGQLTGF